MMAGVKGRSGGKRPGAGLKKKADLEQLHASVDAQVGGAVWESMIGALVKKAMKGDVKAFRELRICRFGHIPIAAEPIEDARPPIRYIEVVKPKLEEETGRPAHP
jgi:hypothetical protein